jgi:hypothetical protein
MVLLMVAGCSEQPQTEHHVVPTGYCGVYKLVRVNDSVAGYRKDGNQVNFTIPEDGVLQVGPDEFEEVCLACNGLSAQFTDGQMIPLYSPLSPPLVPEDDIPMLLGILAHGDTIWYAVGQHEQLTVLLAQIRKDKYQKLEQWLPSNRHTR